MADTVAPMYRIALEWNSLADAERTPLRELVTHLVGYPCKIAAMAPEDDTVNLVIFNISSGCIKDYLDIQSNGAIGVAFDLYEDADADGDAVGRLSDACEEYNESIDVEFASDSEESEDE